MEAEESRIRWPLASPIKVLPKLCCVDVGATDANHLPSLDFYHVEGVDTESASDLQLERLD